MCCMEEGSNLGFGEWLRAIGGVLESAHKREELSLWRWERPQDDGQER